jgi:hypothetical protein
VLKEVATGKMYYNMDIEDIEERLANGYYRRWKDFLGDIRTIMHDAMTMEPSSAPNFDKQNERLRKTQELVNNVEVDLESFRREKTQLDQQLTVYFARVLEEYRDKKAKGLFNPWGDRHPIGTTTNQAPIVGRPPLPGERRMDPPPITPMRYPHAHTNGDSLGPTTNGSTMPSRPGDGDGDVTMADVTPAQKVPEQILSQRSALEKMAPGSQVDDYRNSGSTTTSGQNNSNRTSGAGQHPAAPAQHSGSQWSTHTPAGFPASYALAPNAGLSAVAVGAGQPNATVPGASYHQGAVGVMPTQSLAGSVPVVAVAPAHGSQEHHFVPSSQEHENGSGERLYNSNGTESRHYPRWESAGGLEGGSQIPDTQPNSEHTNSWPQRSHGTGSRSSTQLVAKPPADLANLLNPPLREPTFELREEEITMLHELLAEKTSGFSVEQLIQLMAECVNEVIKCRNEWDKRVVIKRVRGVFEDCKRDIEDMQVVMEGSYGDVD